MSLTLRCPTCAQWLTAASSDETLACANSHVFHYEEDVLVLLDAAFQQKLTRFLAEFEPLRQ